MEIVRCLKVEKIYRQDHLQVPALRGIDMAVDRGEFLALAGPSGSGKTTLLNLIGGLDRPTAGEVLIEGVPLEGLSESALARLRLEKIGFVFQAYNLIPVLSALENVEFIMLLQGIPSDERKERAHRILQEVGLEEMIHRRPSQLSGGQQQRVAVARSIVANPHLVLADEPTANLDSKNGHDLLDMMQRLNEEKNITFIFSTHDHQVMERARRLIQLRDGKVVDDQHRR
ncbi:MAG: ABC transporter ATP-binding protein [Deltaproteobacteria bacterium]|nr:ABC transporter ATP-binding protein [Deltaproteobacteria bacterium]